MTVALAFLTYMDRVCISVTAPAILRDLRLTTIQMGFVFSAFTAAYALFEIPTGWWADRIGSRRVLTRIVTWWSIFTGLTGLAWNFPYCAESLVWSGRSRCVADRGAGFVTLVS
jgi:ACS family glucarate transporter-like MFS transporter